MTTADRVSTIVAALAVLIALVVPYLMWRMRREHVAESVDPTEVVRSGVAEAVSVRLVAEPEGGQAWRFELDEGSPPASLDVFSFKRRSGGYRDWWHHELMDGPRELVSRQPVEIAAPPPIDGAVYEVSVGWTTGGTSGGAPRSAFVLVPSAPPA